MAYDEGLAARIDAILPDLAAPIEQRKMFGGLCYLIEGHMFVGILGDELLVRLGEPAAGAALARPHVREMDFTGRPAKGLVFVGPAGMRGRALRTWVVAGAEFARALPPKKSKKAKPRPTRPR